VRTYQPGMGEGQCPPGGQCDQPTDRHDSSGAAAAHRLVLFVEGEHDVVVLHEWFGPQLEAAAIRVVPLRDVDNLVGLPESGLVQALKLPVAVLCDDTNVVAVREGRARTRGERAVREFLRQAQKNSLDAKAVGLSRSDIVDYLDEDICRQLAPTFPGWEEARLAARKAGYEKWKDWVRDEYGLSLDAGTIRRLARDCRAAGRVPDEIVKKVGRILGYAA
jgi:hypothetical protein